MNILHYSLGFPPYRRGGMTKYCMDLITEQIKTGHNVSMLWPGCSISFTGKVSILKHSDFIINKKYRCKNFEIINPMPVPLLDGINDISMFILSRRVKSFGKLLIKYSITVLHIHTLMGLPTEFIDIAIKQKVKIVYTSHDYFGICPKSSLFCGNNICVEYNSCRLCQKCNTKALSLRKIKILQSPLYRTIKNTKFVLKLRKNHQLRIKDEKNYSTQSYLEENNNIEDYEALREYYINMLNKCNVLHFNSSLTKRVYMQFVQKDMLNKVISISHSSIVDCRHIKELHCPISFSFLGPCEDMRKGFITLKTVLDELYPEYNEQFILNVFGLCSYEAPYLIKNESYNYSQLKSIMDRTDLLIVPSVWFETFGFTVLEALSYGVPVLISKNVGAHDIVADGKSGLIYDGHDISLKSAIVSLLKNKEQLVSMNRYIVNSVHIKTITEHSQEIIKECYL